MTSIQDRRKSRYSKKKIVSNDDLYKSNDPSVSIDSVKVPEQSIKIETAINKRPKRKNTLISHSYKKNLRQHNPKRKLEEETMQQ